MPDFSPASPRLFARALWAHVRAGANPITLDALRSDLSHEPASKIARLSGLAQQWLGGDRRPTDVADALKLLRDLERLYLRHASLAFARFGSLAQLLAVLGSLDRVRALVRAAGTRAHATERLATAILSLRGRSQALVESLSSRYAARIGDIARVAADEVRRELGRDDARGAVVALEGADAGAGTWVPRRDAAVWTDVLRNVVRNAVQATEDRRALAAQRPVDTVNVRLLPRTTGPGTTLEVLDDGVGMTPERIDAMWRAGTSSHGPGRGQGLTEGKRAFVFARARCDVRSAPGVGTCVRLELPVREITIRPPQPWMSRTLLVPLLVLVSAAGAVAALAPGGGIERVDVVDAHVVRAVDGDGGELWTRDLAEDVVANWRANDATPSRLYESVNQPLLLRDASGRGESVVLSTRSIRGPGHLHCIDRTGATRWRRQLHWVPPVPAPSANLKAQFEVDVPRLGGNHHAIAVNVRAEDYSSTAIQFFSTSGESLGAYYHPGQFEYWNSGDLDGDGHPELVLVGVNNRAHLDPVFPPHADGPNYTACVVVLDPDRPSGQGYPYTTWPGMTRAQEKAYLLVPPVRWDQPVRIQRLFFERSDSPGRTRARLQTSDGRIYSLGGDLRPLACGVGDFTLADRQHLTRALGPLIYVHGGVRENIDLPIARGD